MYIETHGHWRGKKPGAKQSDRDTIEHGIRVAYDVGYDSVMDMPNTDPPITTRELAEERIDIANNSGVDIFYGIHMGATTNLDKLRAAVDAHDDNPQITGIKMYAGESTGDLAIIDEMDQFKVYQVLANAGYEGVLIVHCEKEDHFYRELWNPEEPITHTKARPELAEIVSIQDQVELARAADFAGKLHIAHISTPIGMDLVAHEYKQGFDISMEICPHHFMLNRDIMNRPDGLLWKMNPPLRSEESRSLMVSKMHEYEEMLMIAGDHAPHTEKGKKKLHYSGVPVTPHINTAVTFLRNEGFSEQSIENLTFHNANERFGLGLTRRVREVVDRRDAYWYNPFESVEEKLGL